MAEPSLRELCQAVADATARRDAPGTEFGDRYQAMRARAAARVALIEFMQADDSAAIAIAEFAAAEARTAWQSIETADEGPFDEPQLVCLPSGRRVVALYDGRRWWNEDGSPIPTPTARIALPAAPEAP